MHKHVAPLALALFSMSINTYAQLAIAPRSPVVVEGAQPGTAIVPGSSSAGRPASPTAVEAIERPGSGRPGSRRALPSNSSSRRSDFSRRAVESVQPGALRSGAQSAGTHGALGRPLVEAPPASATPLTTPPRPVGSAAPTSAGARARPRTTTATAERPTSDPLAEAVLRRMARTPESAPLARRIDALDGVQGRTTSPMEAQTAYQTRLVTNSLPHGTPAQKTAAAEAIVTLAERLKSAPLSRNIDRLQNCLDSNPLAIHTLNLLPEVVRALPENANALTTLNRAVLIETVATAQARLMGGSATDPHNVAAAEQLLDPSLCGPLSGMGRR